MGQIQKIFFFYSYICTTTHEKYTKQEQKTMKSRGEIGGNMGIFQQYFFFWMFYYNHCYYQANTKSSAKQHDTHMIQYSKQALKPTTPSHAKQYQQLHHLSTSNSSGSPPPNNIKITVNPPNNTKTSRDKRTSTNNKNLLLHHHHQTKPNATPWKNPHDAKKPAPPTTPHHAKNNLFQCRTLNAKPSTQPLYFCSTVYYLSSKVNAVNFDSFFVEPMQPLKHFNVFTWNSQRSYENSTSNPAGFERLNKDVYCYFVHFSKIDFFWCVFLSASNSTFDILMYYYV